MFMKLTKFKSFLAFVITCMVFALTSIVPGSNGSVNAFDRPKQGQDYTGKNCERIDSAESSTFGKCESVCKDKEITGKDVENNRYICKAAKVVRNPGTKVTNIGEIKDASPSAGTPKPIKQTVNTKTAKDKKFKKN
jgi:hypothetical protein